jgi:hypothetical protein
MGVFNVFVVIPQLFVAFSVGFIVEACGNNVAAALATGGVPLFFSLLVRSGLPPSTHPGRSIWHCSICTVQVLLLL